MDRRSNSRCPVCHGPTAIDTNAPEGIRCRNSICSYNYTQVSCPRCQELGPAVLSFEGGVVQLECKECKNRFKPS